jgi:hypothetical protein
VRRPRTGLGDASEALPGGDAEEWMPRRDGVRAAHAGAKRQQSRAGRLAQSGATGGRDSSGPAESSGVTGIPGRQLGTGDQGLRGSDGFEGALHGGHALYNRCRSANPAGQKCTFVKRNLFGWAFAFLHKKSSKKRNQTGP